MIDAEEKNKAKTERRGCAVWDGAPRRSFSDLGDILFWLPSDEGAWGEWRMTADGYRFLFGVVECSKLIVVLVT